MEDIRNATLTVGATAVLVSPEALRGQRVAITLVNASSAGQVISLSWGQEAKTSAGIVLFPSAGWSESVDTAFIPSNLPIWAIASAAGGTLAIQERIKA